jgi:hypothetical protein
MYTSFFLAALALTSFVSAVPLVKKGTISFGDRTEHYKAYRDANYGGSGSWGGGNQPAASGAPAPPPAPASASGFADADKGSNPFSFPLANGFPNIQNPSAALDAINQQAHGTLSNAPPPAAAPVEDDLLSLRLIAFNELFEVAYFTELLANITNTVPGYEFQDQAQRQITINAITAVIAQEELHNLNANGALARFNAGPIQPCQYQSPVSNFKDAITLAQTFTDVVLGTLGDVQTHFGLNGASGLIRGVAASIGQEGEQNGYYRNLLGKIPSANAFLTASTREFAFSALNQNFIVPGSCPNIDTINLPIFGALSLDTPANQITAQDTTLSFSFDVSDSKYSQWSSGQDLSLVLINQQNVPIVQKITVAGPPKNGKVSFTANFPFSENLLFGLTIGVLAKGDTFANIVAVANATVFGPALIEVL